ncbi:dihydrodipicolinate synthase family protein [Brevibacterium sp. RIT 803]|uniref:dihydrodipicolinate synthase family protein n=1 Tax=Brevibacterium sp. RIT 803 TaxID=2810210 RepID=UPI00194EA972|nr:dihydrodipicolinate synthase family protein [Brevibacterium sp. RIT 803]MBM6588886.1 dihydrodipicolinate synthase family protein [Brevibacterium sp. RIT 803]
MRSLDVPWRGYFAAVPTPFTEDGPLDLESLRLLIRYFINEGAHGLVINGSSGEWYAQDSEERESVARVAVDETAGAIPVIIGVSSIAPQTTRQLIAHAGKIGADGVMFSPPPGWRLNNEEIVSYFTDLCKSSTLPVMLYNIPADVATDLAPSVTAELAEIEQVVAIKESNQDDRHLYETSLLAGDKLRIFGNLMNRPGVGLLASDWGADGYIGSGMLFGRELSQAFEAVWVNRLDDARLFVDRLTALQNDLNLPDGNGAFGGIPGQLKAILNLIGQPAGFPRRPRLPIEGERLDDLRRILVAHGMEVV